jgi:hypothetical protein
VIKQGAQKTNRILLGVLKMILSTTIAVNILLFYYVLFILKKNLHKLEIFAYWCSVSIIVQNISAILYLQLHKIIFSEMKSLNWADSLNRTVLFPLLVVWFLNMYAGTANIKIKLLLIFIFLNILCGVQLLSDWGGLFKHQDWKLWWSYAITLSLLLTMIGFMKLVRFIFYRKDRSNEFYI